MKLLYLAIAYLVGIAVGQFLWQKGWFGCGIGDLSWIAALALIPVCLWMDVNDSVKDSAKDGARDTAKAAKTMRWPAAAGFAVPRRSLSGWLTGAVALAGVCGVLRLGSHPPQPCLGPSQLAYYNLADYNLADYKGDESDGASPRVTMDGYVASYPVLREGRRRLDIEVESLELSGERKKVSGRLRVQTEDVYRYRYGESVRVRGELTEPPIFEDFDYRAYLARKRIHSLLLRPRIEPQPGMLRGGVLFQLIYEVRNRGEKLLNRLLPEPHASLANGMLLGIEAGIPRELYDKFNLTGTSHVIVISGSNVALVTGLLMAIGIWLFGKRRALWPALGGLAFYALLVGGDAAVMRAALMGSLFAVATVLGRQSTALVSLAAACWLMTLWNPLMLWDVGFQLSSSATAGLILIGPALTDRSASFLNQLISRLRKWGRPPSSPESAFLMPESVGDLLRDALIMSIAANIATFPLIAYYFGRVSLISLLANLLIAPVQPWIMIFGGIALTAGLSGLEQVAQYLLFVPFASLRWTTMIVDWSASFQGAGVEVDWFGGRAAVLTYAAILGLYWRKPISSSLLRLWRRTIRFPALPHQKASTRMWLAFLSKANWTVGVFAAVAGLVWWIALTQPDGRLHVQFLDVGQGDGIFIQTPSGRQVLIDGGDDSQQLYAELGAVMPFWDRRIDYALVTHPDWDHLGGQTDLPERFKIDRAIISENTRGHEDSEIWLAALRTADEPVDGLQRGGWLDLGDGVALWALWPPPEEELRDFDEDDKNERSLVLRLVYGDFTALLTGDAGQPSEERLLRGGQPLASQLLKVGHHGSGHSSGAAFVEAVGPSVAVIQVGAENRYGHPDAEVLEILDGRLILRNDVDGRIHIWSDGKRMWIESEGGIGAELYERSGAAARPEPDRN